jgi:hypothetical protein
MLLRMRGEVGIEKFLIRLNHTLDRISQILVDGMEDGLPGESDWLGRLKLHVQHLADTDTGCCDENV